jgi:hypothetical protein
MTTITRRREAGRDEVFRKSRQDERFRAAAAVWRKLTPTWRQVLSDDQTRTCSCSPPDHPAIHGTTANAPERPGRDHGHRTRSRRRRSRRDRDRSHRRWTWGANCHCRNQPTPKTSSQRSRCWVDQTGEHADCPGARGRRQHIPDKLAMRTIYARLRGLDDGLPPIEKTTSWELRAGPEIVTASDQVDEGDLLLRLRPATRACRRTP